MKRAMVQYHLITSAAFGIGFAGLLLWTVVHFERFDPAVSPGCQQPG